MSDAKAAMKLLRVLNCMSFARYFSIVAMGTDDSDYWMEKFSQNKGNPFALLADLDAARQNALWDWAKEEAARQGS